MEPSDEQLWDRLQECLESAAQALANLAAKDAKKPFGPKDPKEAQKEMCQGLQPVVKRLEKGMTKLLDLLTSSAVTDPEFFSDKIQEQLCQIAAIASVLSDHPQEYLMLLAHDKTLEEVFGLTQETLQGLYQAAKYLYEHQLYQESAAAFSVLTIISPKIHTFWMGLGNSEYLSHNYEGALVAYAMSAQSNPHDPLCHFFSARCYEAMNQKELAINALELAVLAIGDKEHFATWKQKALEYKQRLSKRSS